MSPAERAKVAALLECLLAALADRDGVRLDWPLLQGQARWFLAFLVDEGLPS